MSDLAWAVKNGDLDQVKEFVEGKVKDVFQINESIFSTKPELNFRYLKDIIYFMSGP